MSLSITLTVGVDATSGPFPPNYPLGANGFTAAGSNPVGSSAGSINKPTYFGATILAIANDAVIATQFMVALLGTFDAAFIGNVTTPDGKVYTPSSATLVTTLVNGFAVTCWIWPLAVGGAALANGNVVIANTNDTLIQLQGSAPASTQINLSWVNIGPTPPTNYLLYRSIDPAVPTLYQTLAGTVLTYSDTGLASVTTYDYYVQATYADGTTSQSGTLNLTTPASGISNTFNCSAEVSIPDGWVVDTLANLRLRVAISSGYAAQAANLPPGMKAFINEKLQTAQKQLYRQHWEKRNVRMYAWQMEPNIRYYGLQADESGTRKIDPLSVEWCGFEDLNQAWHLLIYGIDPVLYTRAQISTGWPTHYEIRSCIEIFPAPKQTYTLWIKGRFGLDPFAADTDTTTIDSESIYLLATGFVKSHYGQKDAQAYLTQALSYTKYLVAGQHRTARYVPRTRVQTPMTPPRFLPVEGG